MKPIHDAMYARTPITEKQRQAIQEVHDLARDYVALDERQRPAFVYEVRKLTNGRQRWLATRHTPPDDPNYAALMALLDGLIASNIPTLIPTAKGWFTTDELKDLEAKIEREDGRELIVFPKAYPWRVKPDKETGRGGIRDEALYRAKGERKPDIGTFQVTPRRSPDEKDWWDD